MAVYKNESFFPSTLNVDNCHRIDVGDFAHLPPKLLGRANRWLFFSLIASSLSLNTKIQRG